MGRIWGWDDSLTFMPRLVRNILHALQSRIQTLWGMGGGGGEVKGWTCSTRAYGFTVCQGTRGFGWVGGGET